MSEKCEHDNCDNRQRFTLISSQLTNSLPKYYCRYHLIQFIDDMTCAAVTISTLEGDDD